MKKLLLTIAVIIGITLGAAAQDHNQGLFGYAPEKGDYAESREGESGLAGFGLPSSHGLTDDVSAPVGEGILLLVGFGAAYLASKKRK